MSIHDGSYRPGFFVVLQLSDFAAAPLPSGFDIKKGMATVLQAARRQGDRGPVSWIELRVTGGIPVGQMMRGSKLEAFNAQTGEPVAAVARKQFPQNSTLPYSLRQRLKILHRFWSGADVPGVYFEFLTGLILFGLLITGLILYFKLLRARAKIGRGQWFWLSGGVWRGLHRSISVLSAVFLLFLVITGTLIGFDNSWSAAHGDEGGKPRNTDPVRLEEAPAMTATTVAAMQRLHPGMPIKAIRLRTFGAMKQAVVITGGDKTDQLLFDTANANQVSLTEPSYPKSNPALPDAQKLERLPFGRYVRHSGAGDKSVCRPVVIVPVGLGPRDVFRHVVEAPKAGARKLFLGVIATAASH